MKKVLIIPILLLSSAVFVLADSEKMVQGAPCSPILEAGDSFVLHKPGYPTFSDEVWKSALAGLEGCVNAVDICVVNYDFDNSRAIVLRAETFEDDSLKINKSAGKQQMLFAAVQVHDGPYEGCFIARRGFSMAAPWFSEGWVMKEKELLVHFDIEKMEQVGDIMVSAEPKEITSALRKAYFQLFRHDGK